MTGWIKIHRKIIFYVCSSCTPSDLMETGFSNSPEFPKREKHKKGSTIYMFPYIHEVVTHMTMLTYIHIRNPVC